MKRRRAHATRTLPCPACAKYEKLKKQDFFARSPLCAQSRLNLEARSSHAEGNA
jgi:hypothetical protein